ncbi:putative oxidoreductase [Lachnellula suecica]|uniref:Putative oxidoreductase n=1 Tax=Lachnellula suecica TaxID=602035 RepID=A0A8T9BXS9_9HELO|nr:putative oxidoreductase [Lachnellula suecica]
MSSYLITGVSRGIGFEFLRQLSADTTNIVIGLVRNKDTTDQKIAAELGPRKNIHILQADLTNYASIKESKKPTMGKSEVVKITGGSLDIIIANAGFMNPDSAWDPIGVLGEQPERFEADLLYAFRVNVIGNIHLFMPLILKGTTKKVHALSSAMADDKFALDYDLAWNTPMTISKVGLNTAVAKFSAQYREHGVLSLAICPGMVDVGHFDKLTEAQLVKGGEMLGKFKTYASDFAGARKPEDAVKDVLAVLDKATVTDGSAGTFVSHFGNKQWF